MTVTGLVNTIPHIFETATSLQLGHTTTVRKTINFKTIACPAVMNKMKIINQTRVYPGTWRVGNRRKKNQFKNLTRGQEAMPAYCFNIFSIHISYISNNWIPTFLDQCWKQALYAKTRNGKSNKQLPQITPELGTQVRRTVIDFCNKCEKLFLEKYFPTLQLTPIAADRSTYLSNYHRVGIVAQIYAFLRSILILESIFSVLQHFRKQTKRTSFADTYQVRLNAS